MPLGPRYRAGRESRFDDRLVATLPSPAKPLYSRGNATQDDEGFEDAGVMAGPGQDQAEPEEDDPEGCTRQPGVRPADSFTGKRQPRPRLRLRWRQLGHRGKPYSLTSIQAGCHRCADCAPTRR